MTKIFTYHRLVIKLGWSKSGWATRSDKGEKHTHLASLYLAQNGRHTAICFVLGPIYLALGVAV